MYVIHLESDLTHFNCKILDSYMSRFAALAHSYYISLGVSDISWRIVPQIYNVEFLRNSNIDILILFTQMSRVDFNIARISWKMFFSCFSEDGSDILSFRAGATGG